MPENIATRDIIYVGQGEPNEGRIADSEVAHEHANFLVQKAKLKGLDLKEIAHELGEDDVDIRRSAERVFLDRKNTTLEKEKEELTQRVDRDPLTDLYNRRGFESELFQKIAQVKRSKGKFALLFMDLDNFKTDVNDTLGHAAGDEVLRAFAQVLREASRQSDTLARHGGDEFAAILSFDTDAEITPGVLTTRMTEVLVKHKSLVPNLGFVGVSAGLVIYNGANSENISLKTLIDRADNAMYSAKQGEKRGGLVKVVPWKSDINMNKVSNSR